MSGIEAKVVAVTGASSGIGEALRSYSPSAVQRSCSAPVGRSASRLSPTVS
jgi:NADP-dependent 3-hydroxy acid dehydrogenase YdfG